MQTRSTIPALASCPFHHHGSPSGVIERPTTSGVDVPPVAAIARWLPSRNADAFPYAAVVAEFHRVGKHLVAPMLLAALAGVRAIVPELGGAAASIRLLDRFLDVTLDKWDGRYANPTYLALSLLPLPTSDDHSDDMATIERQYDRLLVQLIADAARFEIAAATGETVFLSQMRPDGRTTAKRCRLGLQIVGPAARRLGLLHDDDVDLDDPIAGARCLWQRVNASLSPAEQRTLRLTMLPVSLLHDEYQFIRILQSFEATFALVAVQLSAAVQALAAGDAGIARARIDAAELALREVAPLFSLVATMQIAAFHTFREFTEGASAIQSRNYKRVESLCRQPDPARLDSPAYHSVPEIRARVLAGQVTLDDAFTAASAAGHLSRDEIAALEQAMQRFAATLRRWRRTHHGVAVRMLGERTGTGYTEGAAYLAAVQTIPVFSSLGAVVETEEDRERASAQPRQASAAHARCPFAR